VRQDDELIYREARDPGTGETWNVFVAHLGPWTTPRAGAWLPALGRWGSDPAAVRAVLLRDLDQGDEAITRVDRSRAEAAAREMGQELPSEEELKRLLAPTEG
jgi:hypothetical protein